MLESLREKFLRLETAALDARAAAELSRLGIGYLPWSRAALRPSALTTVLNDIMVNDRKTVVEFGAGISTVYLAKVLASVGGQLITVDHNADWLEIVHQMLKSNDLSHVVHIVDAPLAPTDLSPAALDWYDTSVVAEAIGRFSIDLALVDGPLAYEEGYQLARYPAFPFLFNRLSQRAAIILDDANRDGERQIVSRWRTLPGFDFTVRTTTTNLAICTRGQCFTADI